MSEADELSPFWCHIDSLWSFMFASLEPNIKVNKDTSGKERSHQDHDIVSFFTPVTDAMNKLKGDMGGHDSVVSFFTPLAGTTLFTGSGSSGCTMTECTEDNDDPSTGSQPKSSVYVDTINLFRSEDSFKPFFVGI